MGFNEELWYEVGWDDLEEAKRWYEAGWGRQLTEEEYKELIEYDEYLPEEKKDEWLVDEVIDAYLFCCVVGWDNPREAYKWYLFGIYSPQDALGLYKAGWDMFEATDWLKSHYERSSKVGKTWLDNPAEARAWKEAGWESAEGAYEWYKVGWRDPIEAIKWSESGVWDIPQFAYEWYSAGWRDPEEAYRWQDEWRRQMMEEPSPEETYKWRVAGWEYPEEASRWYASGWKDPREALKWYKAGWRDPKDAFKWEKSGEWNPDNPEELKIAYRIYRTLNINNPVEAKKIAQRMPMATKKSRPKRPFGR